MAGSVEDRAGAIVGRLKAMGCAENRAGMARYGIRSREIFGIRVTDLRRLARDIGRDHALADAVWRTGSHEAHQLACFLDRPAEVTSAQMDRWASEFENWADCDCACTDLFDKTPFAFSKSEQWAARPEEFVKRGAFSLLAGLAAHDKGADDARFIAALGLIRGAADDPRNFVKKAVSWALRVIGKRNRTLHAPALALARELAESASASARWVGKDAMRELTSEAVETRLARRG